MGGSEMYMKFSRLMVAFTAVSLLQLSLASASADTDLSREIINPGHYVPALARSESRESPSSLGLSFSVSAKDNGELGLDSLVMISNRSASSFSLGESVKIFVPSCSSCAALEKRGMHTPAALELEQ